MSDPASEPNDEWIGRVIDGRYRIVGKLGEGGMGAVFEAEQLALQRRVALKVIHPAFAGNGEVQARFAREAMASGQLDGHPHVATALDFGTLPDGSLYLVMQFVRGPSLRDVVDHGRLPWERAVTIATQIADALSAAHSLGIIHRDLKPDNVSLIRREDDREIAKVLDFGIARVMGSGAGGEPGMAETKLTRIGTVMGTPGYMAPEQAVGDSVNERADLYSLGVMLYEMLVGALPFDGPDLTSILAQQFAGSPPRPGTVTGDASIPPELDDLVVSLLAHMASERPASAGEVHRALVRLLRLSEVPDAEGRADATGSTRTARGVIASDTRDGSETTQAIRTRITAATEAMKPVVARATVQARQSVALLETKTETWLPDKLKPYARIVVFAGLALPLALVVGGLMRGSSADDAPAGAAALDPGEAPAEAGAGGATGATGAAVPDSNSPGVVRAVVDAVRERVGGGGEPAPEITQAIATLIGSDVRTERAAAALVLTSRATEVPSFALKLAELEAARGCRPRQDGIAAVAATRDARVVPYLERMARSPRRGCGFLGSRDCDACIRGALHDALEQLAAPSPEHP